MNDTLLDDEFACQRGSKRHEKLTQNTFVPKAEPRKKLQELRELKKESDKEILFLG